MEKQKWVRISDKQQQQQKLRMNEQVRFWKPATRPKSSTVPALLSIKF